MITRATFVSALCTLAMIAGASTSAHSQDVLKLAVPQRGSWDAGLPELGKRGGIFKKHGLDLEILYTQAGPESIQALIAGSVDIATASGVQAAFGTFGKGAPIRIISSEIIGSPISTGMSRPSPRSARSKTSTARPSPIRSPVRRATPACLR
jgi:NitT/TauT family transport system substrate-binding protein